MTQINVLKETALLISNQPGDALKATAASIFLSIYKPMLCKSHESALPGVGIYTFQKDKQRQ